MTKTEHTQGKWEYEENRLIIQSGNTEIACVFRYWDGKGSEKECEANAKRICMTHNSHDGLLDLCYSWIDYQSGQLHDEEIKMIIERAKQAIAQAEE